MLANLLRMESEMRSDFSIQNNANCLGSKGVAKHLFSDMPTTATETNGCRHLDLGHLFLRVRPVALPRHQPDHPADSDGAR
jgi:hypothetical protein